MRAALLLCGTLLSLALTLKFALSFWLLSSKRSEPFSLQLKMRLQLAGVRASLRPAESRLCTPALHTDDAIVSAGLQWYEIDMSARSVCKERQPLQIPFGAGDFHFRSAPADADFNSHRSASGVYRLAHTRQSPRAFSVSAMDSDTVAHPVPACELPECRYKFRGHSYAAASL